LQPDALEEVPGRLDIPLDILIVLLSESLLGLLLARLFLDPLKRML